LTGTTVSITIRSYQPNQGNIMLADLINEYCGILTANYHSRGCETDVSFVADRGRKYVKICMRGTAMNSVHAFVEIATGNVYKPASWAQPAKGVRYNLFKDMDTIRQVANWSGGYLYK